MAKDYRFLTTCVDIPSEDLEAFEEMMENAKSVTYETLRRHCEGLREWEDMLGYGSWLRMKDDYAVSFYKSTFKGKPCYYFDWSRIEHVWVRE